jgi:hypothetical protein
MGRPAYEPSDFDRGRAFAWAAHGCSDADICEELGISETTLKKYYAEELSRGRKAPTPMAINVVLRAMQEGGPQALTAAFFWLKTKAGYKEKQELDAKVEGALAPVIVNITKSKPKE